MTLHTENISYQIDGVNYIAHLAVNTKNNSQKPAVLVVHEWWGRNDYAKARAEKLASDGFVALAIDLYGDAKTAETPEEATALMTAAQEAEGAIEARFDAAYQLLAARDDVDASKISAMGYCFGGAVVLEMARAAKPLNMVASFHGLLQTKTPMQTNSFNGKVLVFNGADDPMVPADVMSDFENEMNDAKADYQIKSYPGVVHGFTNPAATARGEATGMPLAYDQFADEDSYQLTLNTLRS